mgnify:CR=1 FL=1
MENVETFSFRKVNTFKSFGSISVPTWARNNKEHRESDALCCFNGFFFGLHLNLFYIWSII